MYNKFQSVEIRNSLTISFLIYSIFLVFYHISLMEQIHQSHQKKRFSEEEALEKMEHNIDKNMEKIMNTWFVYTFINLKLIKDLLASNVVNDINHRISSSLKPIFIIVGWISFITWIIGIFSFLISLSGLGFMFSLWFGIGIRVLIYVIFAFAFSLLSLFMGIGLIRFKKRVISLIILGFLVSVLLFIISLIPVGLYSYRSYWSFGGGLFNLIITFVLLIIVLKNEHMFKK